MYFGEVMRMYISMNIFIYYLQFCKEYTERQNGTLI